ncbi:hypothetical protein D3C72_2481390 [compost metagenome]
MLLNFCKVRQDISLTEELAQVKELVIGNYAEEPEDISVLRPFEARVYRLGGAV